MNKTLSHYTTGKWADQWSEIAKSKVDLSGDGNTMCGG